MRIDLSTMPKPCPIFKATGLKCKTSKECDVCPFSHSCPEDMLNDVMVRIIGMIGDYFYEHKSWGAVTK